MSFTNNIYVRRIGTLLLGAVVLVGAALAVLPASAHAQTTHTLTVHVPAWDTHYVNYARGQVTVTPGNAVCAASTCTYTFNEGDSVWLVESPLPTGNGGTSFFTGWVNGDCTGTQASKQLIMDSDKSCTANFHVHGGAYPTNHTLTINNPNNGSGTVTFRSQGVDTTCVLGPNGSCTYTMSDDQYVHLISAHPDAGVRATYPNDHESCFQDGNVFVQTNRRCTVDLVRNPDPVCSPLSTNVKTDQPATFTASNNAGPFTWSAPGANQTSGTGSSFTTSYHTAGNYTVTVTAGTSATCNVNVSVPNSPNAIDITSNMATTFTLTGPSGQSGSLSANVTKTISNATGGSYVLSAETKPGYTYTIDPCGSSNTSCSQSLSGSGGQLSFFITYTAVPQGSTYSCSASPNPVDPNTNTTFTASNSLQPPLTWTFPGAYFVFGNVVTQGRSYAVQYQSSGTYNANVVDANGNSASCTVGVGNELPPPPPQGFDMNFYVSSAQNNIYGSTPAPATISIRDNTNITLEWDSTGVSPTGCIASGAWTGNKTTNRYASEVRGPITTPPATRNFTLRCYGFATEFGGTEPYIEKTITVNVIPTGNGTINVVSNVPTTWQFTGPAPLPLPQTTPATTGGPYSVAPGTYTIVPATLPGFTLGSYVASQTVGSGATVTYVLNYTASNGSVDLKANNSDAPAAIVKGKTAMLTWTTQNAVAGTCKASSNPAGWSGNKPSNNTAGEASQAISDATTFTLTCTSSINGGQLQDSVTVPVRERQCNDRVDNDGDGQVDGADQGCIGPDDDDDEGNTYPQCSDNGHVAQPDNDLDGLIDAADPGCWTDPTTPGSYNPNDNDEINSGIVTECDDGLDNDGDGKIDFGTSNTNDLGCDNPGDTSEKDDPDIREI